MSGTKVTNDPQALNNPKNENPGTVTSDSLAGESIKQGGSFAANSSSRGVFEQPSSSTTTNTTDHSNAVQLDAASSRAERADGISLADQQASLGGPGVSAARLAGDTSSEVPESKPKGTNLQEGGEITGRETNSSFGTDIGGKNDPGRVAVEKMAADSAGSREAAGGRQFELNTNTPYDALGGSTSS